MRRGRRTFVQQHREGAGLSPHQLAAAAAVGLSTIERLERGGHPVSLNRLRQVAQALGIDPLQLWDEPATPPAERVATPSSRLLRIEQTPFGVLPAVWHEPATLAVPDQVNPPPGLTQSIEDRLATRRDQLRRRLAEQEQAVEATRRELAFLHD